MARLWEISKLLPGWAEKAIDECDGMVMYTPGFHLFDPQRSHPRYHALLRKMNLEP